ncbi:hypothetical protein [Rhodococcus erythropolis]|uniref:hypothetical protein n=1 Tax=Rhodococcus erythropolis TaxID=1833 RepID=UPI00366CF196
MSVPGLSALLQNAQQQMVDKYPQVISRDGDEECRSRLGRVAPEELPLDAEDHDLVELEALAFVNGQDPHRIQFR